MSRLLTASIFPLSREMRDEDMDRILLELDQAGAIVLYDVAGMTYYQVAEWPAVQHPGPKSNHPAPPDDAPEPFMNGSGKSHGEGEGVRESEGEGVRESERGGGGGLRDHAHAPPSPFCPAHRASGGTDAPCRACGRSRMQRKVYDDAQMSAALRFEPDE